MVLCAGQWSSDVVCVIPEHIRRSGQSHLHTLVTVNIVILLRQCRSLSAPWCVSQASTGLPNRTPYRSAGTDVSPAVPPPSHGTHLLMCNTPPATCDLCATCDLRPTQPASHSACVRASASSPPATGHYCCCWPGTRPAANPSLSLSLSPSPSSPGRNPCLPPLPLSLRRLSLILDPVPTGAASVAFASGPTSWPPGSRARV